MSVNRPHISVCICSYKRPELLAITLTSIAAQRSDDEFAFSVIVVDNDPSRSAEAVIRFGCEPAVQITYLAEPNRSISLARNKGVEHATGEFIAFIDDDEFAEEDWLLHLYRTLQSHRAAGVLGPVKARYGDGTPDWVKKAGLFVRPEHKTGYAMRWQECRTGNVLFRRDIIDGVDPVFRPEFATGGGDVDFFRRMMAAGHTFVWCDEAVVHEWVPPSRWKRSVLVKRALLRGKNSWKQADGRWWSLLKAIVAVPAYALALPVLQIAGHHLFMRYALKLCDHVGRLLAVVGVNPVRTREM